MKTTIKSLYNSYLLLIYLVISLSSCGQKEISKIEKRENKTLTVEQVNYLSNDDISKFVKEAEMIKPAKTNMNPFSNLDYNKVIAYDFDGGKGYNVLSIANENTVTNTVKNQKSLTQNQVNHLISIISNKKSFGGSTGACFEPHLGIVFYKDEKIVEYINICFECNYLSSKLPISTTITESSKTVNQLPSGFSSLGKTELKSICGQLQFSNCKEN